MSPPAQEAEMKRNKPYSRQIVGTLWEQYIMNKNKNQTELECHFICILELKILRHNINKIENAHRCAVRGKKDDITRKGYLVYYHTKVNFVPNNTKGNYTIQLCVQVQWNISCSFHIISQNDYAKNQFNTTLYYCFHTFLVIRYLLNRYLIN